MRANPTKIPAVVPLRPSDELSDADLVERARRGDRWAEDVLVRRHFAAVAGTVARLLGDVDEAEDVVQDTFAAALVELVDLRDPSSLRAWLVQIAVRKVHRRFRRRKLLRVFGLASGPVAPSSHGPIRLDGGAILRALSSEGGASEFTLDDGSRIHLEPSATVEALANDAEEVVIVARGTSTFDIRPHGPRRWTVECGLATVEVVGTRFTIERSPHRLRVSVERGAVLVRGERVPERARRLEAGNEIVVTDDAASSVPAHSPLVREDIVTEQRAVDTSQTSPAPSPTRRWRELAEEGAWDHAYAELGARGIARESPRADVDGLLSLADIARLSGHPADAVAPLERIVQEHAADPNAALAAFTLGRVEADHLRRPERAIRALERAVELGLPSALEADALGRLERLRDRFERGAPE